MIRVSRTAIELFGLSIHWYGVLIVTGIALGVWLAAAREKRLGVPEDTALDLALLGVPAAIIGARLYYLAFSWRSFAGEPFWRVFAVWEGGLAIYGGILGGLLAGFVYARVKRLNFLTLADLAAPSFALGQAVGRWGNFVNQEAHGGLVHNPSLQFFPAAVNIGGEWYYATFFYESVWCLLIVLAILLAEKKGVFRRPGDCFFAYIFLYALERAVVEGLRTDSLYLGSMRVSQGLSLLAALGVTLYWAVRMKRAPKAVRLVAPVGVLAAMAAAALGCNLWVFVAAAAVLIAALTMFYTEDQMNRGELK